MPASETFRRNAMRGRSLWRLNHVPLATLEGKEITVLASLLFDLVSQDPEDHDVPIASVAQRGLAQGPFVREAVSPQGIDAQGVVLIRLGLQPPQAEGVDAIVAHQAAGLHAEAPAGGPEVAHHGLDAGIPFGLVDVEETHEPDRPREALVGHDDEDDLRRVGEDSLEERRVVLVDVPVELQELAAYHAQEGGIDRPPGEMIEVVGSERPEVDVPAAGDDDPR